MTGRRVRSDREGGWAALEATLLLPLAVVVLGFLVVAGRLSTTRADVTAAAGDAARAASMAEGPAGAHAAALDAARRSLGDQQVTCGSLLVVVDTVRFVPGGEVAATVTCSVALADVAIPGVGGHRDVSSTSVEVIDRLRSVSDTTLDPGDPTP